MSDVNREFESFAIKFLQTTKIAEDEAKALQLLQRMHQAEEDLRERGSIIYKLVATQCRDEEVGTDAPEVFLEFAGLTLVSTIVGWKYYFPLVSGSLPILKAIVRMQGSSKLRGGIPVCEDLKRVNDDVHTLGRQLNIWCIYFGRSRLERKTTIVSFVEKTLKSAINPELVLPHASTPEALRDNLSESSSKYGFAHAFWGLDEASILLEGMAKKDYMATMGGILSKLWDGSDLRMSTVGRGEVIIHSPYVTALFGTTLDTLAPYTNRHELFSQGFFNRFLFVYGERENYKCTIVNPMDKWLQDQQLPVIDLRDEEYREREEKLINESITIVKELKWLYDQLKEEVDRQELVLVGVCADGIREEYKKLATKLDEAVRAGVLTDAFSNKVASYAASFEDYLPRLIGLHAVAILRKESDFVPLADSSHLWAAFKNWLWSVYSLFKLTSEALMLTESARAENEMLWLNRIVEYIREHGETITLKDGKVVKAVTKRKIHNDVFKRRKSLGADFLQRVLVRGVEEGQLIIVMAVSGIRSDEVEWIEDTTHWRREWLRNRHRIAVEIHTPSQNGDQQC